MKKLIYNTIKKMGYSVQRINPNKPSVFKDINEPEFWEVYKLCKPYTMTSVERMYALYNAVNYILLNNIPGVFVECGVWRGGSAMMIAKMLANRNETGRKIYLYDTFEGMTSPTVEDINADGVEAAVLFSNPVQDKDDPLLCVADLVDVQANLGSINFPKEHIIYVKGKVEDTIPANIPIEQIALLRLDTDWYESTKHELIYLFPKLEIKGVIIIDDYGHWKGCKKAVDEYFSEHHVNMLLNRIDYTCRAGIKMPYKPLPGA